MLSMCVDVYTGTLLYKSIQIHNSVSRNKCSLGQSQKYSLSLCGVHFSVQQDQISLTYFKTISSSMFLISVPSHYNEVFFKQSDSKAV